MASPPSGGGKVGDAEIATPRAKSAPGGNLTLREFELGFLEKEPYADTRPKLPNWVRHDEFMRASARPARPVEVATWQLGLRAQTPAFGNIRKRPSAGQRKHDRHPGERKPWQEHFQLPELSFDMIQDLQTLKKQNIREDAGSPQTGAKAEALPQTPGRTPRNKVDPHREILHTTERYKPKVTPNTQEWRALREAGNHPDFCRHMVSIRS